MQHKLFWASAMRQPVPSLTLLFYHVLFLFAVNFSPALPLEHRKLPPLFLVFFLVLHLVLVIRNGYRRRRTRHPSRGSSPREMEVRADGMVSKHRINSVVTKRMLRRATLPSQPQLAHSLPAEQDSAIRRVVTSDAWSPRPRWSDTFRRDKTSQNLADDLATALQGSSYGDEPWLLVFTNGGDSYDLLISRIIVLTDLLGMETPLRTIEIIRELPGVLQLSDEEIVRRVLLLRAAIPSGHIPGILFLRPSLIMLSDPGPPVTSALRKMKAIMPGIAVERQLHRGAGAWHSFVELLRESK